MAPSQSQVVTLAAGSALLVGILFTVYLIKRRNQRNESTGRPKSPRKEPYEPIQGTSDSDAQAQDPRPIERTLSLLVPEDDDVGSPLPDKEGLTVSASWAILNSSNQSSPQLSPVSSEGSLVDGVNGVENDSLLSAGDNTHTTSVLEAPIDEDTILEEKLRTSARLSSTEREVVTVEEINVEYEELLKEHRESESQTFTAEEITEALMATQNPAQGLTERNAEVLAGLLTFEDIHLRHTAVQGIANSAAFTTNQNVLREKGALPRLAKLLELQRMALWMRHPNADSSITVTINAVTNMAINPDNTTQMETCVPTLVDISMDKETGNAICMSSMQALTNLSSTPDHHGHYTRLVQGLYELLPLKKTPTQLQALKILINLSINAEMVPHLLAAKAPEGLLALLQPSVTENAIILRYVTLLANILQVVKDKKITSSSLPSADKAPSPETMYTALLGIGNVANLKNKVFLLCKHSDEGVRNQAAKVYNHLK